MWASSDCMKMALYAGGSGNIEKVYNCFTRLHIVLKDTAKINDEIIKKFATLKDVKKVLLRGNEVQLVVGIDAVRISALCNKEFFQKTSV